MLLAAAILRLALLLAVGLRDDTNQFVGWVHQLATGLPIGDAYRLDLSFPPVMVYVFWTFAHLVPAFGTAGDAGDLTARIAIKAPAALADLGLALGVAYLLRERRAGRSARRSPWHLGGPVGVAGSVVILGIAAGVILPVRLLPGHRSS